MPAFLNTLSFILRHPLNRGGALHALRRLARWQVGSRILGAAVAVPFVGSTRLLVTRGMTGATQNIYCGLHEFEDMAFVLHAMRPGELFVDVGANVGAYTVLAAGAAGCRCIAFEPLPETFRSLSDNIRLNDLAAGVVAVNAGVGAAPGRLRFTSAHDTMNHVLADGEADDACVEVPVQTLDDALRGERPVVIKIDVEGYEAEVLDGAARVLAEVSPLAVLIELNGSGRRYGHDDSALHRRLLDSGFSAASYDPLARAVSVHPSRDRTSGNTLYVKDIDAIRERVRTAPTYRVLDRMI